VKLLLSINLARRRTAKCLDPLLAFGFSIAKRYGSSAPL
jgi:hypothetical protein